jgi:hypothetical protein
VTLFDFLFLKNNINVPSKGMEQKKCFNHTNVMDSQHWIKVVINAPAPGGNKITAPVAPIPTPPHCKKVMYR